jgi:hypothetical protein
VQFTFKRAALLMTLAALQPLSVPAQAQLLSLSVELGDVSLTKLPFVLAAEAYIDGLYKGAAGQR